MIYAKEREEVALYMRRLYQKGLTTCSGGNISLKISDDLILITPSRLDKGMIEASQIALIGMDGRNHTPSLTMSMETHMHLAIYRSRADVKGIIHAHPVFSTSFAASQREININLTGESRFILGKLTRADYALMGSSDLAKCVAGALECSNVALMQNHGVITVGKTLFEAFDRIEVLETAARMTLITNILGNSTPLKDDELNLIDSIS